MRPSLIRKGYNVAFKLQSGRLVRCRGAMLHDPTGTYWPKDSMLIAGFKKCASCVATPEEKAGDPTHYLGREYEAHVGDIDTPPKSLNGWRLVGEIKTLYYERPGTKAPGKFYHHMGKRRIERFFKKGKAHLYKRGSSYRMEMEPESIADDRGVVWP